MNGRKINSPDPLPPTVQSNQTFILGEGTRRFRFLVTNGLGGPRSGACGLGTAWHAPTNLLLPLLASMCTALFTEPRKSLVMDSRPDSCLLCNGCSLKAKSNTGGLIDCIYSGQKELSALTLPVLLCPKEGNYTNPPM